MESGKKILKNQTSNNDMNGSVVNFGTGPLTPLHREGGGVFLKCEFLHPGRSHKARVAVAMLDRAEELRQIAPGRTTLLERTGGNLGIALAIEAKIRGYELELVTDPHYSEIKKSIAKRLGAKVINRGQEFPDAKNNGEVIEYLLANPNGKDYYYLHQFANPVNPVTHEKSTGAEIVKQLLDYGVSEASTITLIKGLGTGASMYGIRKALSSTFKKVVAIGVQPEECDLGESIYREHGIQGIAVGEAPPFFDVRMLDRVISISKAQAMEGQQDLLRKMRFNVGISSGANYSALERIREEKGIAGNPVYLTVLYDRGEDYD